MCAAGDVKAQVDGEEKISREFSLKATRSTDRGADEHHKNRAKTARQPHKNRAPRSSSKSAKKVHARVGEIGPFPGLY